MVFWCDGSVDFVGCGWHDDLWESGMVLRKGSGGRPGGMDQVTFLVCVFFSDLPKISCSRSFSRWVSAELMAGVW